MNDKKYKLSTLVSWGKIREFESKKLEELGFTEVLYGDRIGTINKPGTNFQFWFSTSRRGWTTYSLATISPYEIKFPETNKYCYSLWQCIKKYMELQQC